MYCAIEGSEHRIGLCRHVHGILSTPNAMNITGLRLNRFNAEHMKNKSKFSIKKRTFWRIQNANDMQKIFFFSFMRHLFLCVSFLSRVLLAFLQLQRVYFCTKINVTFIASIMSFQLFSNKLEQHATSLRSRLCCCKYDIIREHTFGEILHTAISKATSDWQTTMINKQIERMQMQ